MQWELLDAAEAGDAAAVGQLLASGADPDGPGLFGARALHLAARHAHTSTVEALLAAGAGTNW